MSHISMLLIDGNNFVHRYYHGVRDRPPSEAIGFGIGRLRKSFAPSLALMVFDGKGTTWRHELWPAYKADRDARPDQLVALLQAARRQCEGHGLRWVGSDGVEADDLLASYTSAAVGRGLPVDIVSGDKDLLQLVRDAPDVRMHDEIRRVVWTPAAVRNKYGVDPSRIPDLLALIGDKSDNYPGIEGVGPKRAKALLERPYATFEDLLSDAPLIWPRKSVTKIREMKQVGRICHQLATLRSDLPLPIALDDLRWDVRR